MGDSSSGSDWSDSSERRSRSPPSLELARPSSPKHSSSLQLQSPKSKGDTTDPDGDVGYGKATRKSRQVLHSTPLQ